MNHQLASAGSRVCWLSWLIISLSSVRCYLQPANRSLSLPLYPEILPSSLVFKMSFTQCLFCVNPANAEQKKLREGEARKRVCYCSAQNSGKGEGRCHSSKKWALKEIHIPWGWSKGALVVMKRAPLGSCQWEGWAPTHTVGMSVCNCTDTRAPSWLERWKVEKQPSLKRGPCKLV